VGALPGSLTHIGTAEGWAERAHRGSVDGKRAADAAGIPRLSAAAEAAISSLRTAPDDMARADAWRAAQKNERITDELRVFKTAVEQRFGDEGVREMLRQASRGKHAAAPVTAEQQIAVVTAAINAGKRADVARQRKADAAARAAD